MSFKIREFVCFSERAKTFWAEEDVDQVFNGVFEYLDHLKRVLKKHTATDKGLISSSSVVMFRLVLC